jgi:hypothetical protein
MFNTTKPKFRVRTLKSSDPNFTFSPDGIQLVSRAAIEISQHCPENYRDLILECIGHGWLKPVAIMKESEFTWEMLQK